MDLVSSISRAPWIAGFKAVPCSHERCRRWLTQRALDVRHVGLTFEENWYCSYRCAASALQTSLAQLLRMPVRSADPSPRMPLGLMLLGRGLITEQQLRHAGEQQQQSGGDLGEILEHMGCLQERQTLAVRAAQWGCPIFAVEQSAPDIGVRLPTTLLHLCGMVPLHWSSKPRKLLVGFAYGIDYAALYAMEQQLTCKTHPCFITPAEMRTQLDAYTSASEGMERTCDASGLIEELAGRVLHHGIGINADRLNLARCRSHLWARFTRDARVVDVIIRVPGVAARPCA